MESNSDKQLREKLQGFEVPFDPEAWAQMEDMLDKKKKRRGFFWWWFGGIAAGVLLVGVLGYRFGKQEMRNELAANSHAKATTQPTATNNGQGNPLTATINEEAATNSANTPTTGTNKLTEGGTNETVSSANKSIGSGNGLMADKRTTTTTKGSKHKTNSRNRADTGKGKADISKRDKQNAQQLSQDEKEQLAAQPFSNVGSVSPATSTSGSANVAQQTQLTEVEALNLMWADKLNRGEDKLSDEKKEVAEFPKKKKIFRYSIGVMGGLYATTPGWKNYNKQDQGLTKTATIAKAAEPTFYRKPSWMVGLTHDFTFVDRFAFTNGLLYSQTTFKLYSPYAQAFSFAPDDYTCSISELAIPTGIKVYPVATKTFRFYVSAGFIHHVKLKEEFKYTYTLPSNNVIAGGIADTTYNFFPTNTDFTGSGYDVVQADALSNLTTVKANTTDFSINQAKRYYTSFYAGFGVEGIIKKHWVFFAEPTYSMTMQRIGYQERRKYNFGGNAGFRYQF